MKRRKILIDGLRKRENEWGLSKNDAETASARYSLETGLQDEHANGYNGEDIGTRSALPRSLQFEVSMHVNIRTVSRS